MDETEAHRLRFGNLRFAMPAASNAFPQLPGRASFTSEADAPSLNLIDSIVERGIREHKWPGAVVLIGHDGHVIFRRAYGHRTLIPQPMTVDTVFDMASLTKVLCTATAVMQLYQEGRFRLDDPVAKYLTAFAVNGKGDITIRQLLTHYSGLPADLNLNEPWTGREEGYSRVMNVTPTTRPACSSATAISTSSRWECWWRSFRACPWSSITPKHSAAAGAATHRISAAVERARSHRAHRIR